MAIALLGAEAAASLLAGPGRVTLVNRTAPESDLVIAAAAIVRHRDGEDPRTDALYALDLEADQSIEIEVSPPMTEAPDAVEVVLRVRIGDAGTADAYAVAHRLAEDPSGRTQFGIKDNEGLLVDGEDIVSGFPEFAIYAFPKKVVP